ncbi:UGT2B17 [Branchiostoma lanceolatum]|uniref:UDP-glucuronosyltransferase n=1 Tax=Branchiostoma lanceolatum TaxID=7740 RepID=A0A8J9ZX55_BRALA|nr:UGT2B17 [Branchiostoma lanceolatum]
MAAVRSVLFLLLFCSSLAGPAQAAKVLMMGPSGSHWLNLVYLAEGLISKGHDVVSVVPSNMYDNQLRVLNTPARRKIHLERYEVPLEGDFFDRMIDLQVELSLGDNKNQSSFDSVWTFASEAFKIVAVGSIGTEECEVLVFDEKLISKLQQMNFDIIIIDPAMICGTIVARLLNIPLVIMEAPFIMSGFLEYATQAPVPVATFYSFRTDFRQRLKSLVWHCFAGALMRAYAGRFRPIASRALGYETTILELMAEADLFLMRGDFIMHPPHPAMPNMVYIGGYHVQNVNPLPKELERFLQDAGDAGVVVLSFGSYAKAIGMEKAEMLAAGLARVPFKVIWKFQGQRPKNTGENTLLMKWIPQNDLLAHPKTRLFITHCGINAVYEAMFHGVPMVRVPAFAEQHGNSDNLETLGTGVTLDIFTMTSDDLYEAITEVANNKTYKSAAVRLAQLQRDQPQSPMDRAVWWIEHVIRHGGLPHLKSAARHLSLLQYHLLDVAALLCGVVVAVVLVLCLCCRCCCRVLCGKKTAAKQKQQ